jgi:hypothetical protein
MAGGCGFRDNDLTAERAFLTCRPDAGTARGISARVGQNDPPSCRSCGRTCPARWTGARGGLFKMLLTITIGRLRLSPEYAGRPELAFSMRSEPLCG